MAHQQYQRFRFKDQERCIPIHLINNESYVFLEDIQAVFRCRIQSFIRKHGALLPVRNKDGIQQEPLRIQAFIDEIIVCDEPYHTENHLDLNKKMDELREHVLDVKRDTELLIKKTDAILRQTFGLAEFSIPRLFIIVPDDVSKFNPQNLFRHSYRLFFLCEFDEDRHLALHEGYELRQPRQFVQKYGPYLKQMITVFKCALIASSIIIPPLGSVGKHIHVPSILMKEAFWDEYGEMLKIMTDGIGKIVDNITSDDSENITTNANLEGADLRQIEGFLKQKDAGRKLANLYRTATEEGDVRWVCIHHYKKFYSDKIKEESRKKFRSLGGIIRDDEVTIDEEGTKDFDKLWNLIVQGLYLVKLILRDCRIRDYTFEKLLNIVGERPWIKYLELFSINVSSVVGFKMTHLKIIEKLDATVRKRKDLTIKYIVEYPKNPVNPDPDLFDFALKQSTERLLLYIYTRDDGKKIVLQHLNKSDLLQMAKSLGQSKTITHCSIDEFNGELSNILQSNKNITKLTIFLVKFDEQKVVDLKNMLSENTCLHELRFSSCENLSPLITMLSQELANNNKLKVLAVNGISVEKQISELAKILEKNHHLIELNLALDTYINVQTLIDISRVLKINNCLKLLKLTGIRGGVVHQDSSINLFETFFRKTSITQLTLNFYDHKSKTSLFRETIQTSGNIESLDFINCNILPSKNLNDINPIHFTESLTSLSLHSCQFAFDDIIGLFRGLIHNKTLTALSLNNLFVPIIPSNVSITDELVKMLESNTALKKMTYSHGSLGDKAAVEIGQALTHNNTLEELNVSDNRIGADGALALINAINIKQTLLYLNIRNNNIQYDGVTRIFQSLKTNVTLKHLHIFQSSFKENPDKFNRAKQELFNDNEFINID